MSAGKRVYTFESERESRIAKAGAVPIALDRFVSQLTEELSKPIERNKRSV